MSIEEAFTELLKDYRLWKKTGKSDADLRYYKHLVSQKKGKISLEKKIDLLILSGFEISIDVFRPKSW